MDPSESIEHISDEALIERAAAGDRSVLSELFERHSDRLRRMVRIRLNDRLRGRIDELDIVQDACLEATRRLDEYLADPAMPFFLWLRHITGEKLIDAHRRHLLAQKRDATREVPVHGVDSAVSCDSIAARLVGHLTSPSQAALREELRVVVQNALEQLDPMDREVLVLRHFEQLNTNECAAVLNIGASGASSRYVRALRRLQTVLAKVPGLIDQTRNEP